MLQVLRIDEKQYLYRHKGRLFFGWLGHIGMYSKRKFQFSMVSRPVKYGLLSGFFEQPCHDVELRRMKKPGKHAVPAFSSFVTDGISAGSGKKSLL
jgi:hypothetical protein